MFDTTAAKIFNVVFVIAFVTILIFILKSCIRITTKSGSFVGVCKDKYTGLEGYGHGGSFTCYYLVFEKDNEKIVLNCSGEQYGLITIGDKVEVNYKVINNKEKWLDSYKSI